MLTVPGLAVRNLRHRRVRTMFLAALVLILSAALFTSRVLTESMKTCIDKTVDRIGADVIVAPGEYESDLSDSLFSGGLCSFYFEKSLMDQVKKTDGIDKISPQLYIASLDAACCSVPVQIVAFEPESDFIVQPWMSGSNVSELKKGQTVVGSKITAKAGDKISFFGQEYEVAGKLEETGTSYDNCAFMNFETAYTLFDSFQIKYVTDLTEPQKYVSLLTIRTKDGADPKEVANTINTKMRDSGLKAYTAKAMSGKVSDTLEQMQSYSALLIGLLSDGHVLLEGVPGLAKTLAIKTLASLIDAQYSRIQFTPDLLPADVIGTMVYSQKDEAFQVKKGPVFANFVLADEINRAPAKVQSALLEAMQERQVTIGKETFRLPEPFLVLATQNPIEQEGTYPLPEAQVDRFMLKVVIDYPKLEEEKLIIRQNINGERLNVKPILKADEIIEARKVVRQVYLDEKIEKYIVDIVFATRYPEKYDLKELKDMIGFGGSPRASINLALAARSYAFIKRRGYVIPEDVRAVAHDVLRHRIGLTYEAEASNMTSDEIVSKILNKVEVP